MSRTSSVREMLKAIHDRGDLIPWLNGETECFYGDCRSSTIPFTSDLDDFTFRPIPKPPVKVLRPWTPTELEEHAAAWFRSIKSGEMLKAVSRDRHSLYLGGWWSASITYLAENFEWLSLGGQWLPCGTLDEQPHV